jgi:GNAT superfamily N-acetyltransferase
MTTWTADAVRAAAADWVWVPPDAKQIVTSEYQLIAYPEHYQLPTAVAWSASERRAGDLIDEVAAQVRAWRRDRLYWWVRDSTRPADTEQVLRARGGTLDEVVDVLAFDLSGGALPQLGLGADGGIAAGSGGTTTRTPGCAGLRAEVVLDEPALRASYVVSADVWDDHHERTEAEIAEDLAGRAADLESGASFVVVVFADGQPAASGGCAVVAGVARLWGAGTRPQFRGRGAYRVLLAARIEIARQHGATLALVKGRVGTSGPILRRAGFLPYGQERCYRLAVASAAGEATSTASGTSSPTAIPRGRT